MSKPSQETLERLNAFLDSLPAEVKGKCVLCNETLTHFVKKAEAETGAPTASVTRELANRVNEGAAPGDVVSGKKLQDRVRYHSGADKVGNSEDKPNTKPEDTCADRTDKTEPKPKECPICKSVYPGNNEHCPNKCEKATTEKPEALDAQHFCFEAVGKLRSIPQDDTKKITELMRVLDYIIEQIRESDDSDALSQVANKLAPYNDHKEPPDLPNCRGRKFSTEERDDILFRVEKLFPGEGRLVGWDRAGILNKIGLKRKGGQSLWTPKDVRENLRHAKTRRDDRIK